MDISCSKLNLLYLTNQTFQHRYNKSNSKSKLFQLVEKEELDFYRKRIFQTCKDILRGKCENQTLVKVLKILLLNALKTINLKIKKNFIKKSIMV